MVLFSVAKQNKTPLFGKDETAQSRSINSLHPNPRMGFRFVHPITLMCSGLKPNLDTMKEKRISC